MDEDDCMNLHYDICPFCLNRSAQICKIWDNTYLDVWCMKCFIDGAFTPAEIYSPQRPSSKKSFLSKLKKFFP